MVGGSWGGAGSLERSCFSFNILCGFTVYKFTIEYYISGKWQSPKFSKDFPSNALRQSWQPANPIEMQLYFCIIVTTRLLIVNHSQRFHGADATLLATGTVLLGVVLFVPMNLHLPTKRVHLVSFRLGY